MPTEIERKFLVEGDEFIAMAVTHYDILQGYIVKGDGRTIRIRLRTAADGSQQAFLTIKTNLSNPKSPLYEQGGKSRFTRFEWEHPISVEDFQTLLPLCGGRFIDKTRYILPAEFAESGETDGKEGRLKWEIDVFRHPNKGLVMAEIELPTEDTAFVRPSFLREEVTHDPRYYNANMI